MSEMDGSGSAALITPASLASLPDFRIGEAAISPSRRIISGPAGQQDVEPRVMQVLVALAQANGAVVTRNALFDRCWGGTYVGDDSLNRTIAALRRAVAAAAPGSFEIETIPRTGYRLAGAHADLAAVRGDAAGRRGLPRRAVVGAALAAGFGGAGLLWAIGRKDDEFDALMTKGEEILDYGDPAIDPEPYLRRAVALRPDDPRALGLFAYARVLRSEFGQPTDMRTALNDAESASRAALAIDPRAADARLARMLLDQSRLDLATDEARTRDILGSDPDNIRAMRQLWDLLQCVGRSRDALSMVDRALAVKPLAAANNYPRAQLLWILGRNAEADRVIDVAMKYWPSHRFVRYARFTIFTFTDRPRAALAMLDGKDTAPQAFSPEAIALWRRSLSALDQRSPATISAARNALVDGAQANLGLAFQAVMVLSELGEVDAAFDVANKLFVIQRPESPAGRPAAKPASATSTAWRFAPWLFIPPTASLRADPRFDALCEGIGLTDYWKARHIMPDYKLRIA